MHTGLCRAAIFVVLLGVAGQSAADPPKAFEGQRLYVSYCQLCHGPKGGGDGPLSKKLEISPADLTTTIRSRSETILRKIITGEGRQTITGRDRHNLLSDAMPEWSEIFDEEQVDALIAYLRFLSRSDHELMGDPTEGMVTYQKYCQSCHGVEGEGDGVMTTLMGIEPVDHSNPNVMNSFSNEDLAEIIFNGAGDFMPSWHGILSEREVEGLVSYIRLLSH